MHFISFYIKDIKSLESRARLYPAMNTGGFNTLGEIPAFRAGFSFSIMCILHHAHAYDLHVVSLAVNSYGPTQVLNDDISHGQRGILAYLTAALNKAFMSSVACP